MSRHLVFYIVKLLDVSNDVVHDQVDLVQASISQLASQARFLWADVVVMNPPFGTRRKGADLEFLRAAFQVQLSCLAVCAFLMQSAAALHTHVMPAMVWCELKAGFSGGNCQHTQVMTRLPHV